MNVEVCLFVFYWCVLTVFDLVVFADFGLIVRL